MFIENVTKANVQLRRSRMLLMFDLFSINIWILRIRHSILFWSNWNIFILERCLFIIHFFL